MHRSFNSVTNEHNIDNFNIDFIRYFSRRNLIANVIGSVVASFLFFFFDIHKVVVNWEVNLLFLYFLGIAFVFTLLVFVVHKAGNTLRGSLSLTIRRGLFSYIILSLILILGLLFSGDISFLDPFGKLYYMLLSGQIFVALVAVPLDFAATFSLKD